MKLSDWDDYETHHCIQCGRPIRVYKQSENRRRSIDGCLFRSFGMAYWLCDESCCPKHNP